MIGHKSYQEPYFDEDYDIFDNGNECETCDEDLNPRSRKHRMENE